MGVNGAVCFFWLTGIVTKLQDGRDLDLPDPWAVVLVELCFNHRDSCFSFPKGAVAVAYSYEAVFIVPTDIPGVFIIHRHDEIVAIHFSVSILALDTGLRFGDDAVQRSSSLSPLEIRKQLRPVTRHQRINVILVEHPPTRKSFGDTFDRRPMPGDKRLSLLL